MVTRTAFALHGGAERFAFGNRTALRLVALLEQRNVNAVLGHRSRSTYALTHLAPTKRYQRLA